MSDRADMQGRMELLSEALGLMSRTMTEILSHLCESGRLRADDELVTRWKETVDYLDKQGLKTRQLPGDPPDPTATCSKCKSVLRNVKPGDRCDWCGFVFPLHCPSCGKQLERVTGEAGDLCLWCHHQF